jgi:DNA-directed RNA polymerase subunit M/transcription elongation factor TFIIS
MRCVCGYEYSNDPDDLKVDEKFVRLRLIVAPETTAYDPYRDTSHDALFACPKCGTVRADYTWA